MAQPEKRENSVLFSLRELRTIEESRVKEEEDAAQAAEQARVRDNLAFLQSQGLDTAALNLAWDFTTATERFNYDRTLSAVTTQTRNLKTQETAGLLTDLLNMTHLLPVKLRKALTRLMPLTGNFVMDTAVLNNLGRVPDLPDPAGKTGRITAIRFSPPTSMPMGVAVGAVTLRGELTLTFRYRLAQFDRHAAEAFRDLFVALTRELVQAAARTPSA